MNTIHLDNDQSPTDLYSLFTFYSRRCRLKRFRMTPGRNNRVRNYCRTRFIVVVNDDYCFYVYGYVGGEA